MSEKPPRGAEPRRGSEACEVISMTAGRLPPWDPQRHDLGAGIFWALLFFVPLDVLLVLAVLAVLR